ncbi:hypothetical protein C8Q74DRAFT_1195914 [Fomes fomentarius]|nr:hypothetical protein C8Q74DRAFT_1195914 [Fomes fomentarius]
MSLVADVQNSACAHSTLLLTQVPSLDNTFGAVLLGTCAGLVLFGLTVHQSYRYFRMYPQDSSVLKIMVRKLLQHALGSQCLLRYSPRLHSWCRVSDGTPAGVYNNSISICT